MTDIPSREPQPVEVPVDGTLTGFLLVPQNSEGLVLFTHVSGSSRFSRRSRAIADVFQRARIATLLCDLLTPEEQETDDETRRFRSDMALLAGRTIRALDWVTTDERTAGLPFGLFGSGTGAAAVLGAAAERHREVRAVVCRGARTDLAAGALSQVLAPTLLVVGGLDQEVLRLNREAVGKIPAEAHLEVIAGATHLFEEAGKLDEVAMLARDWFLRHFASESTLPGPSQS